MAKFSTLRYLQASEWRMTAQAELTSCGSTGSQLSFLLSIRYWFAKARRLHDIHHRSLDHSGKMDTNFGIGFYFYDRLFGTIMKHHRPFNWSGFEAAKARYSLVEPPHNVRQTGQLVSAWLGPESQGLCRLRFHRFKRFPIRRGVHES
jgi:hypothetical protein